MTLAMERGQLEQFIYHVRASGRYSFSWDNAREAMPISDKALRQGLYRMKQKQRIAQVRKGFYVIITPEYSSHGQLPPYLFLDDMMHWLNRRYYVGLLSAAALHGAAHQQPMKYYVIIEPPAMRNIQKGDLSIDFFVKKSWDERDVIQKKTDAGYINVSIPEITALDLLTYGNFGINRVYTILEELSEEMKRGTLARVSAQYFPVSSVQRLGYLLDKELGNKNLAEGLLKGMKERETHSVFLQRQGDQQGNEDKEWKVFKNIIIENDL